MRFLSSFRVAVCRVAAGGAAVLALGGVAQADVFTNVPEASGYSLVYTLDIPSGQVSYNNTAIPYTVNNSALFTAGTFDRVAYYLELTNNAGLTTFVYASFDRPVVFVDGGDLGVPSNGPNGSGIATTTTVTNMNVVSSAAGITTGTGLTGGKLEFAPSNYGAGPDGVFNHNDSSFSTTSGFGSMQIHNTNVPQTLFAYNGWGSTNTADLGIGNRPTGEPDWTFAGNTGSYTVRSLQILARVNAAAPEPASAALLALTLIPTIAAAWRRRTR